MQLRGHNVLPKVHYDIVLALAFIGPIRDPVRNIWTIEWGLIAMITTIPFVLIAGAVRGVPFFWQLIDIVFAIFGIVILSFARSGVLKISGAGGE